MRCKRQGAGRKLRCATALLVLMALLLVMVGPKCTAAPPSRVSLYEGMADWLDANAITGESVGVEQAGVDHFNVWPTVMLPVTGDAFTLLEALETEWPDYVVAMDSLAWEGLLVQPAFRERYHPVYQVKDPYDAVTPLTLYRYRPSPFDGGEFVAQEVTFAGEVGEIRLLGYRLDGRRLSPGVPLHLSLHWMTPSGVAEPLQLVTRLVGVDDGQIWWRTERDEPGGMPTDLWLGGVDLTDRYVVAVPDFCPKCSGETIPEGAYRLEIAFYRPSGEPMGQVNLVTLEHPPVVSRAAPTPDVSLEATFGEAIELVGFDAPEQVAPGDEFRVALYWHALAPISQSYKIFMHLVSPEGALLAQDDSEPAGWTYPTTVWEPGEYVRDVHALRLPPAVARGDASLVVGIYDSETSDRLPLGAANGGALDNDRLLLQRVRVR